ncbi:MAG: SusC/RagA family TonB-linked outer membrane protein [Bacteroidia bacterium]|nr:MAG: SusC/RagA family TonB-linked outer membrane protein [Bacteroidia bacterium]
MIFKLNYMRKLLTTMLVLLICASAAIAQSRTIKGSVKDEKGEAVPFATITEVGTKNATVATEYGEFTMRFQTGSKLEISAIGYESTTITPGAAATYNVVLNKTGNQMQEVVVSTALGLRKQPRELGYSVAKVGNAEMTKAKVVNIQQGLTGKVSGLNIATVNNGVFADTRITLRGIRSLTGNNQPMLIVDGTPVALGQIENISPNYIEDVTVLKGASAASLYGPDGVNGVIYVKTFRGNNVGKPVIKVNHSSQYESILFLPKFQTQFGAGSGVDANGFGVYTPYENQQYGDEFDGSIREIGKPMPDGNGGTVVQTEQYSYKKNGRLGFFERGLTTQNGISYSAKDYLLSVNDVNIKGTLGGDKNRRTTFRFAGAKEYGIFKGGYSLSYTKGIYNVASVSPYWDVFNTPGNIDIKKYKNWRDPNSAANPNYYFNEYYHNPYFTKDRSRSRGNSDDILAQIDLSLKLTNWLSVNYKGGTTISSSDYKNTNEAFVFNDYAKNVTHKYNASNDYTASVSDGISRGNRLSSELFINMQKEFNDFNIEGLIGQSFRQSKSKSVGVSGSNLIIPTLFNISNRTGEPGAGESNSVSRLMGIFGRVSVGYKNWAFLELTGRQDWDSRLPINKNSFFYPGASASVVLTDALKIKSDVLSYLKVRGSWSKSGNVNVGVYALESNYGVAGGFPYGSLPGFQASTTVNNPAIKPEFVNSMEAGLEVSFLKNRINFEATAYLQNNTDQVLSLQISRTTGFANTVVNAADFDNKGLELDLRLTPLVRLGDFDFDVKANVSFLDSKVKSVYLGLDELTIGNGNYIIKGYPAYMFKLTDYKRDPEGRVIVDKNTGYPALDPTVKMFGRTMPKLIAGISPSLSYKGLSLNLTADYKTGHLVYHGIGSDMDFTGTSIRSGSNGRQRFIFPNSVYEDGNGGYTPNTTIAVQNGGYGFYENSNANRAVNSNYITSAAAWKIREIALSYVVPEKWVAKTKYIKSANISLTARNFFTFLPKSNQWTDPEFANTTGNALGVNNNSILPPSRIYGFAIDLQF